MLVCLHQLAIGPRPLPKESDRFLGSVMSAHIIAVFGKLQIPSYPRIQERYLSQSKILKILLWEGAWGSKGIDTLTFHGTNLRQEAILPTS